MLWGSIAAEATAALGSMSTGTSGGVNGRVCLALAFLRHFRRSSRERLDLSNLLIGATGPDHALVSPPSGSCDRPRRHSRVSRGRLRGHARSLRRRAAQFGANVLKARDARHALTIMKTVRVNVIVSDLTMPGEDGLWLLQQIRRLTSEHGRSSTIRTRRATEDSSSGSSSALPVSWPW